MKINQILNLMVALSLISCGNNETQDSNSIEKGVEVTKDIMSSNKNIRENARNIQSQRERLLTLQPIEEQKLIEWLPITISDLERTDYKLGKRGFSNTTAIKGEYKDDNGKLRLRMEIVDGAGENGSKLVGSLLLAHQIDHNEENKSEKTETLERNGLRIIQSHYKKNNSSTVQFIIDDRFSVNLKGFNMLPEELWAYVDEVDFSGLKTI